MGDLRPHPAQKGKYIHNMNTRLEINALLTNIMYKYPYQKKLFVNLLEEREMTKREPKVGEGDLKAAGMLNDFTVQAPQILKPGVKDVANGVMVKPDPNTVQQSSFELIPH